ncbi:hypothetical protein EB151_05765, partial [archaeon]|nr:hypothetical protein [archaeon]
VSISTDLNGNNLCSGGDFNLILQDNDFTGGTTTFTIRYGLSPPIVLTSTTSSTSTTISNITGETIFEIVTQGSSGCSATDTLTVYVPKLADGVSGSGSITTTATVTICPGDTLNAPITSSTDAALHTNSSTATIEYEWQILSTGTPTWTKIIGSTDTNTLTQAVLNGLEFTESTKIRRVAKAVRGDVECSINGISNIIEVVVSDVDDPVLSSSLGSFEVCSGQDITIQSDNNAGIDTHLWYLDGTLVSSDTTNSYTIRAGQLNSNAEIGLIVLSSAGCSSTLVSQTIQLNDDRDVSISTDLNGNNLCSGGDFNLILQDNDFTGGTTTENHYFRS